MVNVAAITALEMCLAFSVIRVNVAAMSTFLTRVLGRHFKKCLARSICFIFGENF